MKDFPVSVDELVGKDYSCKVTAMHDIETFLEEGVDFVRILDTKSDGRTWVRFNLTHAAVRKLKACFEPQLSVEPQLSSV